MGDCGISSPDMSEVDAFVDRLKANRFWVDQGMCLHCLSWNQLSEKPKDQHHHNDSTWANQKGN